MGFTTTAATGKETSWRNTGRRGQGHSDRLYRARLPFANRPPQAPPGAPCVQETQLRSLVMAGPKTNSWWFRGLLGCRRDGEEKEGGCLGGRD